MSSGTQEISTASNDLSRRTEQQASSLEETAAALDEITATVKKAAEGATHARKVVAGTKVDAEKSGEVVRKAVEAMGGIEKSSQQISQIIGVIDEIAFQTNLLALNAGVEAARAGDAGRGFAVVASEVRALAQRSAEAAKEIKGLISTSTTQVGQGVQLVAETGKSLERIMAKVAEINTVVSEIAAGAQEQATGLQQVNTAVNEMDKVTQQNAAMAEEATAAGRSLAQEAEQLTGLVGQFQLGNVGRVPAGAAGRHQGGAGALARPRQGAMRRPPSASSRRRPAATAQPSASPTRHPPRTAGTTSESKCSRISPLAAAGGEMCRQARNGSLRNGSESNSPVVKDESRPAAAQRFGGPRRTDQCRHDRQSAPAPAAPSGCGSSRGGTRGVGGQRCRGDPHDPVGAAT